MAENNEENSKILPSNRNSEEVFHVETNWPKDLEKYQKEKKNLAWGQNPKPSIITKKIMSKRENIFNPISQRYYDNTYESHLRALEKTDLKNKLAHFYDNELRNEQTFNVISLKDKLQGFENDPNYPKPLKEKIKLNKEISNVDYNILSNISLSKHHFNPPEKRPICTDERDNEKYTKPQKINIMNYKDYDIISNKYKMFHNEKKGIDDEIEKLNAAKKLYKARDYDTIRGVYYDPEKQRQYEEQLKQKNELLAKNAKKDQMFNPVNNLIYNKEKLEQYDMKNKNQKMRYTLKPQLEEFYHIKDYQNDIRKENYISNRLSYNRYKIEDQRGYDFVNMKNTFNNYKVNSSCKNKKTDWELLQDNAGENETFSKKGIYKNPYDKTDIQQNNYEFMIGRRKMLKNLSPLENDSSFKKVPIKPKSIHTSMDNINTDFNLRKQMCNIDKVQWFNTLKSVEMPNIK